MRPLVPILAAFLSGIIAGERLAMAPEPVYVLLGVTLLVVLVFYLAGLRFSYLVVSPPFFFIGMLFIMAQLNPELPADHIRNILRGEALSRERGSVLLDIEAEVKSLPVPAGEASGPARTKLVVSARRALVKGRWESARGDVLLSLNGSPGPLVPGERLRVMARVKEPANFGNPGEFDYRRSLNAKGIYVTGFVKGKRFLVSVGGGEPGLAGRINRTVYNARRAIGSFIDRSGAHNKEALKALVIGERSALDPALKRSFTDSGIAHVLAISGLHMSMVALLSYAIVLFLLKRSARVMLAINVKSVAAVVSLVPVAGYALLAGTPVSATRSAIMIFAYVFTLLINRGRDFYNVLALAALMILAIKPQSAREVSFQLTFAAVFFIIYLTPRLYAVLGGAPAGVQPGGLVGGPVSGIVARRVRRWLRGRLLPAFLVTLAATLGTYPVLAYHFNMVSFVGVVSNIVVVPLTGVVVPLLLGASWLLPVSEGLAQVLLYPADRLFSLIAIIAGFFSSLPYASMRVATPTLVEIFLFYAIVVLSVKAAGGRLYRLHRFLLVACVLLLALDLGYGEWHRRFSDTLKVTFISVGQGDSALVEFPRGAVMLIDGGGFYSSFDPGERIVAPLLWRKKIRTIDYMVLSHAQHDHMGGLSFITRNFNVREFWWNGVGELGPLGSALASSGVPVRELDSGAEIPPIGGVVVEVLHPSRGLDFDINDMSLVLKLSYGDKSLLFTGDIGAEAEEKLGARAGGLDVTVLKSPHHGSRTSSSEALLAAAGRPAAAVISVGRANIFGFPAQVVLDRYGAAGMEVYRTDLDGAVEVVTDGEGLSITPYARH